MKAATLLPLQGFCNRHISIHAAREGGDLSVSEPYQGCGRISIHAAREGGDVGALANPSRPTVFQSTPPVKAATAQDFFAVAFQLISIHAAREGGDASKEGVTTIPKDFNPRRP